MAGIASSTALLFRMHLRRVWWSRRALACAVLAAAPPGIAWIIAGFSAQTSAAAIAANVGWLLLLQVVVPLLTLVAGSAVVTEEIEDRTITYLFSRPIPRASVLLGRWLGSLVFVSVLLALSGLLLLAAASRSAAPGPSIGSDIALPLLAATLLGGAAYSALFAAAGVFFRHPMIVGLGYAFAVEGFLANLPGRNQALTVQHYLRSVAASSGSPAWREIETFELVQLDPAGRSVATLLVLTALVLAAASWRISRREFVLSA